jgi:hypothetical protein
MTIGMGALPSGAKGRISLTGSGRSLKLSRGKTIRHLRPGKYRISARPVSVGPDTYYAVIAPCADPPRCGLLPAGPVSLKPGRHLELFVLYENVVPRTTRVLRDGQLGRLRGGIGPGGTLVFRGRAPLPFSRGSVIVAPPSATLPDGLLREVLRLRTGHGRQIVTTAPASLADAIPRGFLDLDIGEGAPSSRLARSSSSTSWSLGHKDVPFSCGAGRSVGFTSDATAAADFRFTAGWDRGQPPHIAIAGTLSAELTASLRAEAGASCSWARDVPSSPSPGVVLGRRVVFVGPVPVWITPELVGAYGASAAVTGITSFGLTERFKVTGGLSYENGHLHHAFDAFHQTLRPVGTPTTAAKTELSLAPKVYFDLFNLRLAACKAGDCADAPATYLAFGPAATMRVNSDGPPSTTNEPWWRLDGSLKGSLGIHFGLFGFSADETADFDLLQYPLVAPPGRPRNLSAEPGDESAKVSWQPPPANPGPVDEPCACKEVSGYTVYVNGEERAQVGPKLTSLTLDHLTNGVTYQVSVRANSTAGPPLDSRQTEPVAVTPEGEAYPLCTPASGEEGEGVFGATGAPAQVSATPTWSAPTDVSSGSETGEEPQLAVDGNGGAVIVWAGSAGVTGATKTAEGPWSRFNLASSSTGDGLIPQLSVSMNDEGDWASVWRYSTEFGGEHYDGVRGARCIGGGLIGPVTIAAPHFDVDPYLATDHWSPSVAMDGKGGAVSVWYSQTKTQTGDEGYSRIEAADSVSSGPWSPGTSLSNPTGSVLIENAVGADANGQASAIWLGTSDCSSWGSIGAATKPAGSGWSSAVKIAESDPCEFGGYSFFRPRLSISETGYAKAVWTSYKGSFSSSSIRSATMSPNGQWSAMESIPASDGGQDPYVAVNANGDATVVFWGGQEIKAASAERGAAWQTPVVIGAGASPAVAMDDAGDVIVIWFSGGSVLATYKPAGGAWGPVTTLTQSAALSLPKVAMEDNGDALVVWETSGRRVQVAELTR